MSWSRAFEDPIELPDGRKMLTVTEAAAYITKVPKAVHKAPEWLLSRSNLISETRAPIITTV